jgi:flagellar protein FlbD
MIPVTRLNGKTIILNALLIESIEETPDTIITLATGKKITVREQADTVAELVKRYLREIGPVNAAIKGFESKGAST